MESVKVGSLSWWNHCHEGHGKRRALCENDRPPTHCARFCWMLPATRYFGIFALVIKTTQSGKSEDSPNLWPVSQILVMNENGDCCSSSLHFLLWEKIGRDDRFDTCGETREGGEGGSLLWGKFGAPRGRKRVRVLGPHTFSLCSTTGRATEHFKYFI